MKFEVNWRKFDEDLMKEFEELWCCFFFLWSAVLGVRREGFWSEMRLPKEALMCGYNLFKSQLFLARARARFVLDSSRVCFTSALNLQYTYIILLLSTLKDIKWGSIVSQLIGRAKMQISNLSTIKRNFQEILITIVLLTITWVLKL